MHRLLCKINLPFIVNSWSACKLGLYVFQKIRLDRSRKCLRFIHIYVRSVSLSFLNCFYLEGSRKSSTSAFMKEKWITNRFFELFKMMTSKWLSMPGLNQVLSNSQSRRKYSHSSMKFNKVKGLIAKVVLIVAEIMAIIVKAKVKTHYKSLLNSNHC